jgi:hypothetical protein
MKTFFRDCLSMARLFGYMVGAAAKIMMPVPPPPPLPRKLSVILKNYPEQLEFLQRLLNRDIDRSMHSPIPLDRAVALLKYQLKRSYMEACDELSAAEACCVPSAMEKAQAKVRLLKQAFSSNEDGGMFDLSELSAYLDAHEKRSEKPLNKRLL